MRWQVDIGNRKVGPSQGGNGDHNGLLVNLDARGTRPPPRTLGPAHLAEGKAGQRVQGGGFLEVDYVSIGVQEEGNKLGQFVCEATTVNREESDGPRVMVGLLQIGNDVVIRETKRTSTQGVERGDNAWLTELTGVGWWVERLVKSCQPGRC